VECDRVLDPQCRCGLANVVGILLERELRRVDADDDESLVAVLLGPRAKVAERAEPVDARVRPEVDEHDLPAQVSRFEWLCVEPPGGTVEAGQPPFDGEPSQSGFAAAPPTHLGLAGTNRWTKSSAVCATSCQPLSMVSEWPRLGIFLISVTLGFRFCRLYAALAIAQGTVWSLSPSMISSGPRSGFFVSTFDSVQGFRFALPICARAIPDPATW